jgi:hypothetical protein
VQAGIAEHVLLFATQTSLNLDAHELAQFFFDFRRSMLFSLRILNAE